MPKENFPSILGVEPKVTKAYDVLNHHILFDKLESYGIRSLGNAWFESYLSNRFQCVEITHSENSNSSQNTYSSKLRKLQWGVPQGSVLGPFLFLLYIDLITFIKDVKIILYADDISILVTDKRKENLNIKVTKVMKQM